MSFIYNQLNHKTTRRELRRNQPSTERLLWSRLRNRQLAGFKFRRQFSVENAILDFYCSELKLAIEIDGDAHFSEAAQAKDSIRQRKIEELEIEFLRFTNNDVTQNLDGVMETILNKCNNLT